MQFNINKSPKKVRLAKKRRELREWHDKFAWWPTVVDEKNETYSRVWLERYMRQKQYGPTSPNSIGDGSYFVKYSRKEYFKKKLNGDFDKGEMDVEADTGRVASSTSVSRASVNNKILKKGGPVSAFKRQLL